MGKVVPFPVARVRRVKRQVDLFSRHFEILSRLQVWERLSVAGLAMLAVFASV